MSSSENEGLRGHVIALEAVLLTMAAISSQERSDSKESLSQPLAGSHHTLETFENSADTPF